MTCIRCRRDEITAKLLTTRLADLIEERTRVIDRLRGPLTLIFPALDRRWRT